MKINILAVILYPLAHRDSSHSYIRPRVRMRSSHSVRVKALPQVVIATTLELSTPSCPMFYKAADCCGRPQHHENRHQLLLPKPQVHRGRKEYGAEEYQLYGAGTQSRPDPL